MPFGLVPLATRCPPLCSLFVPVDTSVEIYPPYVLHEGGVRGAPMCPVDSHLDIGPYSERKPPRFPEQLASLVSTIFPNVMSFGPEEHMRGEASTTSLSSFSSCESRSGQRVLKRSETYFEFEFSRGSIGSKTIPIPDPH